jgi:hypothetical protein
MVSINMLDNLADISVFENLQSEAPQLMGFSSLSVFNATFRIEDQKKAEEHKRNVENWKKKFIEDEQYLKRTKPELKKKKAGHSYDRLRMDRILCRNRLEHAIREFKKWGIIATSTELKDD